MGGSFRFSFTRPHLDDWLVGMEFIPKIILTLEDDSQVFGTMFSIGLLVMRLDYFEQIKQ